MATEVISEVRDNSNQQVVNPGDSGNTAVRVNVVAGGAGGGVVTQGTASNLNATVVGTVTNIPSGTQSVSGAVTVSGTTTVIPSGTQPVSGTIAATESGAWTVTVTQGTASNLNATVAGTVTSVPSGTQSIAYTPGTTPVTQVTSPWVVGGTTTTVPSGTQAVSQSTGTNLHVVVDSGTIAPSGTQVVSIASGTSAVTQSAAPWSITVSTSTSAGVLIYRNISLGTAGTAIKTSAGNMYGYFFTNNGTSSLFVKVYNVTTAPTGTDTPVLTYPIPAGGGANMAFTIPISFSSGIGIRATTVVTDTDATAPAANQAIVDFYYA